MHRTACLLSLLLLLPAAARAQDAEATMVAVYRRAAQATNPTMELLRGLVALPDGAKLDRAAMQRVLERSGFPRDGVRAKTMGFSGISRSGRTVELVRDDEVALQSGSGWVGMGQRIRFSIKPQGGTTRLEDVEGVRVGQSSDFMVPLRWASFSGDLARINGGWWLANKTIEVDLSRSPARSQDPSTLRDGSSDGPSNTPGVAGRLRQ